MYGSASHSKEWKRVSQSESNRAPLDEAKDWGDGKDAYQPYKLHQHN